MRCSRRTSGLVQCPSIRERGKEQLHLEGIETVVEELLNGRDSDRRDAVLTCLTEKGIGCGVYYPVPIHQQRVYTDRGYNGSFPEAERAAREVISLPVHPALSSADLETIIAAVNELVTV